MDYVNKESSKIKASKESRRREASNKGVKRGGRNEEALPVSQRFRPNIEFQRLRYRAERDAGHHELSRACGGIVAAQSRATGRRAGVPARPRSGVRPRHTQRSSGS